MAVTVNVNGGSELTLGTGTPLQAEQQLSTIELLTDYSTTDVVTYAGATTITGQAKYTLHLVGYQDWNAGDTSVCRYLEEHQGTWVDFTYWQYGQGTTPGTADETHPKVSGQVLVVAPKRGDAVDAPEAFDVTLGVKALDLDYGA